ncbi:hypothetical protein GEV33_001091 [Tenebrio molitor]|uniref:Uncharacterized protein n=1 Tax=Tenebrio molitor TaxID=7067 RepID=A0A8J6HVX7_TENMO|nr:hypothetical protein GEV33_001091 [Tenebrio molitor]
MSMGAKSGDPEAPRVHGRIPPRVTVRGDSSPILANAGVEFSLHRTCSRPRHFAIDSVAFKVAAAEVTRSLAHFSHLEE